MTRGWSSVSRPQSPLSWHWVLREAPLACFVTRMLSLSLSFSPLSHVNIRFLRSLLSRVAVWWVCTGRFTDHLPMCPKAPPGLSYSIKRLNVILLTVLHSIILYLCVFHMHSRILWEGRGFSLQWLYYKNMKAHTYYFMCTESYELLCPSISLDKFSSSGHLILTAVFRAV